MNRRYLQGSVKEAIDNLPSGVCFFASDGLPVLCNRTMYRLAFAITGRDLQTYKEFKEALKSPAEGVEVFREGDIYILPDKSAWHFSYETVRDETGASYTQLLASDVSAIYTGSIELSDNIEKLREVQGNIRSMKKDLVAITRENEILSMKMRVHDELGSSLLKLRRYYLGTGRCSKEMLIDNLRKTVAMLQYKNESDDDNYPMADLIKSAESIGTSIVRTGDMPSDTAAARLIVRAVRQCLTNAVKHAGGNTVFVNITNDDSMTAVVITNDGKPPEGEISEGGGLSLLRKNIERAGGTMEIQSSPIFALKIKIPIM